MGNTGQRLEILPTITIEKRHPDLQAVLARPAINEQAVRVKLEELRERDLLSKEGNCWRLTGFLGSLASGVSPIYSIQVSWSSIRDSFYHYGTTASLASLVHELVSPALPRLGR